jgi:hypothetical protein
MSIVFALQPPVVSQTLQHTWPGAQAAAWSVYVRTVTAAMTVVNAKASAIIAKIFFMGSSPQPRLNHARTRPGAL